MRLGRIILPIAIVALTCASAPADDLFSGIRRLFDKWGLFEGFQISGSNTLTLQGHSLEGSRAAYEGQYWDTDNVVRRSSLHLEGPIWGNLGLQADISASGWGNDYSRYVLGYTAGDTAIYFGDLNIRLSGNEFASFSKTFQGWQLDQRLPNNGLMRAFYTTEKGLTRRETISGNNTSGPFFLRYTPIIEGSEVIKVDEEIMRFGRDYRLDYETGQLWFEPVDAPPRIIPSTSVISASYQSYGYESSPGILYGARAEMPLLDDRMLVGVTALMQDRREGQSAGDTAGFQEDIFHGSGTTGPFDVNFRPILPNGATVVYQGRRQTIDQSVVVLVDSVEQVQSVDYDVYHDIGRILFRRAVPPTSLVIIRYYYDLGEPAVGTDTRVLGLDLGYRIAPGLNLRADWAQSDVGGQTGSGRALRTSLSYARPNLSATAEFRDVQPEFSYIDTVGFQRRERGLNLASEWQVNDYVSVYERFSDLDSDSGLSFGYSGYTGYSGDFSTFAASPAQTTTSGLSIHTRRNDLGIDVRYPGWPTLSFTHQTFDNSGGSTGSSSRTTDALVLRYAPQDLPFTINASLDRSSQLYLGTSGTDSLSGRRGSDTDQMQISATYTPSSTLSFAGSLTNNSSTALGGGDRSSGTVTQITARWNPSSRISLNLDLRQSESDGAVSSGFYGGIGGFTTLGLYPGQIPGNPGGGGGGGVDDDSDEQERARYEDTSSTVNLTWRPTDSVNLTIAGGKRNYRSGGGVGYLADSTQTYYNATVGWQPAREWGLTATWGTDELRYLEEGRGAVLNDLFTLGLNYRPEGQPWGLALNLNKQSGSSPTYIGFGASQIMRTVPTNLFDLSGELTYELAPGINLFGRLGRADYESGYAVFTKDRGELGVRYRMSELADLSFGYSFTRNIAGEPTLPMPGGATGTTAGQNYIAHTFMLEVSSNFSSGSAGGGGPSYQRYSGLSSFGGYGTGSGYGLSGYGYSTGGSSYGFGDFSGMSEYRSATGTGGYSTGSDFGFAPFGPTTGARATDFFAGPDDTRGSSAVYVGPSAGGATTGLGEFRQEQADQLQAPFGPDGTRRAPHAAPDSSQAHDREDPRSWWQWYD